MFFTSLKVLQKFHQRKICGNFLKYLKKKFFTKEQNFLWFSKLRKEGLTEY